MMKNKKKVLLFNADVIADSLTSHYSRAGVYFVAHNILKEFLASDLFEIVLYASHPRTQEYLETIAHIDPLLLQCKVHKHYVVVQRTELTKFAIRIVCKLCRILHIRQPVFPHWKPVNFQFEKGTMVLSGHHDNREPFLKNKNLIRYSILYDVVPLLYPNYYKDSYAKYFKDEYVPSLASDSNYFAISEHTKKDFLKYAPQLNPQKITVALLAANDTFSPREDENELHLVKVKYNIPENKKYLFSLCSLEPRKNLILAVKAYLAFISKHNIDDFVFVLGGAAWTGFIEKLESAVTNFEVYREKIIRAGYVTDEDLPALYSGAEFFVYTSQYEGFGLPPLEAMKCGKAVITSNNSSLPEVVGDAGIMIDYDSLEQHIEAYEKLYFDIELRKDYEKKALVRAKEFSWKKTAQIMIDTMIENSQSGRS